MSFRRLSLNSLSDFTVQNSPVHEASHSDTVNQQQEFRTTCPLHSIYLTGDAAEHAAQTGAFLICPCSQSTSTADTVHSYKHKQERGEITNVPAAQGREISIPSEIEDGYDGGDEGLHERQLKRRKVSSEVGFNTATNIAWGIANDTEEVHLVEAEYDSASSDKTLDGPYPKRYKVPLFTNLDAAIANKTPSGTEDESFLGGDEDTPASDDNSMTIDNDTGSTLNFGSSSPSTQPFLPTLTRTRPVDDPEILHFDHHAQIIIERASRVSTGFAHLLDELLSRLTPKPALQARRNRSPLPFTIYEDEIDRLPGQSEADFPAEDSEDVRAPAINNRILTPLDRGQENRQPMALQVETPVEFAEFLDEDDGEEEEEMAPMRPFIEDRSWWPFD